MALAAHASPARGCGRNWVGGREGGGDPENVYRQERGKDLGRRSEHARVTQRPKKDCRAELILIILLSPLWQACPPSIAVLSAALSSLDSRDASLRLAADSSTTGACLSVNRDDPMSADAHRRLDVLAGHLGSQARAPREALATTWHSPLPRARGDAPRPSSTSLPPSTTFS